MSRKECVRACYPYIENYLSQGGALKHISRHFLGMFNTCSNSRQFRQYMAQNHYKEGADISVLEKAMSFIPDEESSAE